MSLIPDCFSCFKCGCKINREVNGKVLVGQNHVQFRARLERPNGAHHSNLFVSCCRSCFTAITEDDYEPLYDHAKKQWEWEMDRQSWTQKQRGEYKTFFWDLKIKKILEEVPHANA